MSPKKKLQLALSAIVGVIAFGTIGFKLILGTGWFDSFYFSLITLTTIGYGEPPEMYEVGRYFTAALIIMGVGTLTYALSSAAQAVIESELLSTFGKRRMYKDISKLNGHYIICGAGRVGAGVIRDVARSGQEFVVIEGDETIADRLLAQGHLVLMGDATNDDVLKGAGIERARGIVCAVSSDPDNLYITLTARDLNKNVRIVARANEESAVGRLLRAGADKVVSPALTGSTRMSQMLLRPAVADFIELATMTERLELEIEQIEIDAESPFITRALKDAGIRSEHGVIVIAIRRSGGEMVFNPAADTIIEQNDALVVIGSHTGLEAVERLANPTKPSRPVTSHRH
ncbi:MAG TPA: potassium channel protein [Blastocatellia bacterium]|nr:potassium channel protein [Blastocatellia bacterium]